MLILLNPLLQSKPFDIKEQFIKQVLRMKKIDFTEQELVSIVNTITEESKFTATQMFKFLSKLGLDNLVDLNAFRLK